MLWHGHQGNYKERDCRARQFRAGTIKGGLGMGESASHSQSGTNRIELRQELIKHFRASKAPPVDVILC